MRAGMARMRAENPPPVHPDVNESTLNFRARDGHELRALVFAPAKKNESLGAGGKPGLFVFFHGGGGSIGAPEEGQSLLRLLVSSLGIVGVSLEYRLAPEWQWPKGTEDAWDGVKWCAAHAGALLGADLSRGFVVGGVSNGANLASVVAHLARDEALSPALTGVLFSAGSVVTEDAVPDRYRDRYLSRRQLECLDAPGLDRRTMNLFNVCMPKDGKNSLYSALNWETGHCGLPKHYLQACGMDVARDDAIIFSEVLSEEGGVETRLDLYPGMPHIFWSVFGMLSQGRKWKVDVSNGVAWLFGMSPRFKPRRNQFLKREFRLLALRIFTKYAQLMRRHVAS